MTWEEFNFHFGRSRTHSAEIVSVLWNFRKSFLFNQENVLAEGRVAGLGSFRVISMQSVIVFPYHVFTQARILCGPIFGVSFLCF